MDDVTPSSASAGAAPRSQSNAIPHGNARTRARQGAFLAAYMQTARVDLAAKASEIDRGTHYDWLAKDPEYPALFEEAHRVAAQSMLDAAVGRARQGVKKAVYHEGKIVGYDIVYSDRLMERILEAWFPRDFKRGYTHEHTGKDGKPLIPLELWDSLVSAVQEAPNDSPAV